MGPVGRGTRYKTKGVVALLGRDRGGLHVRLHVRGVQLVAEWSWFQLSGILMHDPHFRHDLDMWTQETGCIRLNEMSGRRDLPKATVMTDFRQRKQGGLGEGFTAEP